MLRRMRQPALIELAPLTTEEAAREIGVSGPTVARWVAAGHITPLRQLPGRNGTYLFTPAEVARAKQAKWKGKRSGKPAKKKPAAKPAPPAAVA